jgi:hypothetical protein
MAFYGPSIQSTSLRYAILAAFENLLPATRGLGEDLFCALEALTRKSPSSLDEGDMFAIVFMSLAKRRYCIFPHLGMKSVMNRFPGFSLDIQWFVRSMKTLLKRSRGNVWSYPFADYWRYVSGEIITQMPFDFSDDIIWELLALCRQLFGPTGLNEVVEDTKRIRLARFFPVKSPNALYMESALSSLLTRNFTITRLGLWTVLRSELTKEFARDSRLLTALDDVRTCTNVLEGSSVFQSMLATPLTRATREYHALGFVDTSCYQQTVTLFVTKLFLAILLDGPTIRRARTTQSAIEAATTVIILAYYSVRGPLLPSLVPDSPYQDSLWKRSLAFLVAAVYSATLVYPISHILEGTCSYSEV